MKQVEAFYNIVVEIIDDCRNHWLRHIQKMNADTMLKSIMDYLLAKREKYHASGQEQQATVPKA